MSSSCICGFPLGLSGPKILVAGAWVHGCVGEKGRDKGSTYSCPRPAPLDASTPGICSLTVSHHHPQEPDGKAGHLAGCLLMCCALLGSLVLLGRAGRPSAGQRIWNRIWTSEMPEMATLKPNRQCRALRAPSHVPFAPCPAHRALCLRWPFGCRAEKRGKAPLFPPPCPSPQCAEHPA